MAGREFPGVYLREDTYYDLDRKGFKDQARHDAKVRQAIRDNLGHIISEEDIITSEGDKIIRVPIKGLDLPRFRFDPLAGPKIGQGEGGAQKGDVIGTLPSKDSQGGVQGGQGPGIDWYDISIELDELEKFIFEEMGLPNLRPKQDEIVSEEIQFTDVRKKGIMPNLDKKRTILENIRRNALAGEPRFKGLQNDDLRFKTSRPEIVRKTNAVIIAMRDDSGSMGDFEKKITRISYFWMVRFLRKMYDRVRINFILHDTEAQEVDEHDFFYRGEAGGTKVSSAYQLGLDIAKGRYHPSSWNVYFTHFSDGDNYGIPDNQLCRSLVEEALSNDCSLFAYAEIKNPGLDPYSRSSLLQTLEKIKDQRFVPALIKDKEDVYPTLKKFFPKELSRAQAS